MPFKSRAQRRKFFILLKQGKISPQVMREFERETKAKLPEKVRKKKDER